MQKHIYLIIICIILCSNAQLVHADQIWKDGKLLLKWGISEKEITDKLRDKLFPQVTERVLSYVDYVDSEKAAIGFYFTRKGELAAVIISILCGGEMFGAIEEKCPVSKYFELKNQLSKANQEPFMSQEIQEGKISLWKTTDGLIVLGYNEAGQVGIHYFSKSYWKDIAVQPVAEEAKFYFSLLGD